MNAWQGIALGIVAYQATITTLQYLEGRNAYRRARAYCDAVGKPLLSIGMARTPWSQPNGDVTLDIDPSVRQIVGGVQGDERDMSMFRDKQFGACINSHTLEHLGSVLDVAAAAGECARVADVAVFLCPHPYSMVNLIVRSHHLQIKFEDGAMFVRENFLRLPINFEMAGDASGSGSPPLARHPHQMMVATTAPEVLAWGEVAKVKSAWPVNTNANAQLLGAIGAGMLTYGFTTGGKKTAIAGGATVLAALLLSK